MTLSDQEARGRAAREAGRNLVVTAGAGTGKTSLLVERVLYQVLERGVPLERIAAITFTEKAAAELRDRLEEELDRVRVLAGEASVSPDPARPGDRVFLALTAANLPREHLAAACRGAIAALDRSSLTTLHGFAADLLRRRYREAKVDVGFEIDEGRRWAEVFAELWGRYVEDTLGPAGDVARWAPVLAKLTLDDVEEIARQVARFNVPLEAISEAAVAAEREQVRRCGRRALEEIAALRSAIAGDRHVLATFTGMLSATEAFFKQCAEEGRAPRGWKPSTKAPTVGAKAAVGRKEELKARLARVIKGAAELAGCDGDLAGEVARALAPFITRLRSEFTRRGYVSFDGLIVLARDLLRDDLNARREEGARFVHILVDEFQDTDPLQYEIVFFLAEDPSAAARDAFCARLRPGKLFIVGDAKQSIYRFRGADISAYRRAVATILDGGGEQFDLTMNFRSVPEVLEPLNRLFGDCFGAGERPDLDPDYSPLVAAKEPAGAPAVEVWSAGMAGDLAPERRRNEAEAIASFLAREFAGGALRPRDAAILLRTRTQDAILLRALRARGIPYVAEGGKGFYSRHEVELLLALVRVFRDPADSIALVSCLRSPVCAVPDRELQAHAAAGGFWTLDARVDDGSAPNLARALGLLRELAERHEKDPLDLMARGIIDETPLRLAMAASYEGAQRVANLEKAARRIAVLAADGSLSPAEILESIEAEEAIEVSQGDSPLADETVNAVRILTIHSAKGLEWPLVIVPDLAGGGGSASRDVIEAAAAGETGSPLALAIKAGDRRTPAHVLLEESEKPHRAAEAKRLLYVAMTRAQGRLILVVGWPRGRGAGGWIEPLRAWGYEIGGDFPAAGTLGGGTVVHRLLRDPGKEAPAGGEPETEAVLVGAARAFAEASRRLAAWKASPIRSPSGRAPEERADLPRPAARPRGRAGGRAVAQAAGTAVHLLLELWNGESVAWLHEHASLAARIAAAGEGVRAEDVAQHTRTIIAEAEAGGVLRKLQGEGTLGREVPILFRDSEGATWEGTIDRICGTIEAPVIQDLKTDSAAGAAALPVLYAGQLSRYAEGLRRALGLSTPPEAVIVHLGKQAEGRR